MKEINNFNINENGFYGCLFQATQPWQDDKVLIVCGGSNGNFKLTSMLSKTLCSQGISVLALAYINVPGLPKHTIEAPVESVENAVNWLSNNGYHKIGIYGISSGGELALLSASLIPQITCTVAISAPSAVSQADNGFAHKNTSCWSWRNKSIPFLHTNYSLLRAIPQSIKNKELYTSHFYERALNSANDNIWIQIENINGSVLFLTAQNDSLCPSNFYASIAINRLNSKGFTHHYEHITYEYASHFLLPIKNLESVPLKIFKVERKFPQECANSRIDSLTKTIEWLKKW